MEQNEEAWNELIVTLQRHRNTLKNHMAKIEEDSKVDVTAKYGPEVGEAIKAYIE